LVSQLEPHHRDTLEARDPFQGASEMAALMRRTDWSRTPIGSPDGWPEALRTAVDVCLESRFPIVLWWGPELTLLYNDAYLPMLGAKHPRSLAMAAADCWSEIWPTIGPMLEGVVSRGEATWSDDLLLFIDRRGFKEECYFTFSYSPIRVADGTVGGVFCAVNETTARVRAERRLALFRDLSGIVTDDPIEAAKAAVTRIAENDRDVSSVAIALAEDPDAVIRPTGSRTDSQASVASLRLRDEASGRDDVLLLGRNRAIPFDRQYEEFFDLLGSHVAKVLSTARAQLAERQRADALAALDRAKTLFFTNVSHEFRTPLTLIDAPLGELADDPGIDPSARERVALAQRAAGRLRRLVNTLLEFSRIESGTSRPNARNVDLGEFARDIASVFRSSFESAGLYLRVVGNERPLPVRADPAMLERILLNLISNAFKFTSQGGVEVRVGSDGEQAVVGVVDTGIGIAPADIDRVFDRFTRLESRWSRSSEGSGIGLALASELARIQGGTLTVASEPGHGSTFTLRLPVGDGALAVVEPAVHEREAFANEASGWVETPREPSDAASPSAATIGRRVLIADDNADMRAYLERILGRHWATDAVSDGTTALSLIEDPRTRPDLVLADVMMPGLDGLTLVARIRETPELAALPVLLLSARAGEESRGDGLAAGADDYLVKPFSATDLVARVASQLERSDARRAADIALRTSEARWRTLVEGNPNPIATTDASGAITYLNPAWLTFLGVDPPGPLGWAWGDVIHADDLSRLLGEWRRTIAGRGRLSIEARVRRGDGAYRWLSLNASPFPDADGEPAGWVAMATDVHDQRQAAEARDAFVGVLAHELRTPITSIYAAAVLLERTARRDPAATRSLALDVGTEAERLRRMVDDLVVISRVERGATLFRDEPVLVQRVVDRIVREERSRHPDRTIELALPPGLPAVSGDDGYIEQILRNLISNAGKYGAGGAVTVRAEKGPGANDVTLSVRDRGPGFVDGDEAAVFNLFYRGDTASKRAAGSGIGLYVVRSLVEAMGGAVRARTHPDGGAEVLVTLHASG
jgi:PAS domain S-box-containing protein